MYTSMFQLFFFKGNNFCYFLFASLDEETLQNWGLLLKERISSNGSKFFPFRVEPYENDRVTSPENLSISLKMLKVQG